MDAVERLISEFSKLPGIGRKTAQRLTFFLLKEERERVLSLAEAIVALKDRVRYCSVCFNITEQDPCAICRDPRRQHDIICVVEEPSDLMAIERLGVYKGVYHVLGGVLSPLDGIGPEDLHIRELLERLKEGVKEVILATNPTVEGEATALYISRLIRPLGVKISQIARGLPVGGDIELADEMTLTRAFEGRREVEE
ncbi:MAG: recombination protein RecR [Candidatus Latescibacterota bacterium]|nr:MAG: recombination protein RecR [Candidatus Latescibacterota bacterium]